MSVDRDIELEDRLRARLRQLNGVEVPSYEVLRDRSRRSSLPLLLAAAAMGIAIVIGTQVVERLRESPPGPAANASRCGQLPTLQPTLGVPTPAAPNASTTATPETTVGILVWSDCVRPQTVTARPGQLVQWAAAEEGIAPEIVLDDGTSLGRIQHVLEFQFSLPGTYRYHLREFPSVLGTIVVEPLSAPLPSTVPGFDLPPTCQYASGPVESGQRVLWTVRCASAADAFSAVLSALQAQGWVTCGSGQAADGRSWQKPDWVVTLSRDEPSAAMVGLQLSPRRITSC